MKKILFLLVSVMLVFSFAKKAEAKDIGLSFGMDYASKYLWRGLDFYSGAGVFFPWMSYDIAGSGVYITVTSEITDAYLLGYTPNDNNFGTAYPSLDLSLYYEVSIRKIVTIQFTGAAYWFMISKEKAGSEASFATASVAFVFNTILSPKISYTHDFYFDSNYATNTLIDFYIQLGISHTFKLTNMFGLNLGLSYGLYHNKSTNPGNPFIMDITPSIGLAMQYKGVTLKGGLDFMIVPYSHGDDVVAAKNLIHTAAKFSVAYAF